MLKLILSACVISLIYSCSSQNQTDEGSMTITATDERVLNVINANNLSKLATPAAENADLVNLGAVLFADNNLSGSRNISCATCHIQNSGTSDHLPFSIGTGATGIAQARKQVNGQSLATPRNSPALYNLGRTEQIRAFLDGRVSFINNRITSPVTEINGANPVRRDIASVMTNAFDIQALFPLLSDIEMLGTQNDLASHTDEIAIWNAILQNRILTDNSYVTLFAKAFPNVTTGNLNAGHIGRAIGAFVKEKFKSNNSQLDKYLEGDLRALSESQKRGMLVFYTRGQCVRCHSGSNFTDNQFHSSGVPQIGLAPFVDDLGLAGITGLNQDRYKFKTPSLRNISLSPPYMHNGAFATLEDVVNHYSNIQNSLNTYKIPASYQQNYETTLVLDTNTARNSTRLNQIDVRPLRNGLNLSEQDKSDLVDFLRNGLRDSNFN